MGISRTSKMREQNSQTQTSGPPVQPYPGQQYPMPCPLRGHQYQHQIYVLPYPPPPYQGIPYIEQSIQPEQQYQQYSDQQDPAHAQTRQKSHDNSGLSTTGQSNQQHPIQQGQVHQHNPARPGQLSQLDFAHSNSGQPNNLHPIQQGQVYQYYPAQLGQPIQQNYVLSPIEQSNQQPPIQPGQVYQNYPAQQGPPYSHSVPPSPNMQYVTPYNVDLPSAHGTSMVRPGQRLNPGGSQEPPAPEGWRGFEDKKIRAVFVRKVYTILMLQLLFTLAIIALFVFEPNVKRFVQRNKYLYYISFAIFFAVYIGLTCFQSLRRRFPLNLIILCIFTMAMSYMLGTISSIHNTEVVFMAVGICAVVCFVVSVFSFYTKFDFTSCGGILCILLLILILFGLIAILIPSKVMTMIYGATGALVFTIFLAYDTQMMMGGKNYELSPEEHIFAAVQIYIDIVYIFLFLLLLLDGGSE